MNESNISKISPELTFRLSGESCSSLDHDILVEFTPTFTIISSYITLQIFHDPVMSKENFIDAGLGSVDETSPFRMFVRLHHSKWWTSRSSTVSRNQTANSGMIIIPYSDHIFPLTPIFEYCSCK
jgi:hypothetical protein